MTSLDIIMRDFASKADLTAAISLLKAELKSEIAELRGEIHALDARLARSINRQTYAVIGAVLAMGAAVHFFR
jgi:hypothetical protein